MYIYIYIYIYNEDLASSRDRSLSIEIQRRVIEIEAPRSKFQRNYSNSSEILPNYPNSRENPA